jgi:SAM-dependent methyltransferase
MGETRASIDGGFRRLYSEARDMNNDNLKWRRKAPANRTPERIANHYRVEKEIAERLKRADRQGRRAIYAGMYGELFARVPDHPRLTGVRDPASLAVHNRKKLALIDRFIGPDTRVVEFAPGDCSFAHLVCDRVRSVIGVDISDQSSGSEPAPDNFELHVYDGYQLGLADGSADIVFSDQFIEHLHPDDVWHHFRLVHTLLKPGGSYIFRTPHAFHGPFDISAYFSGVPEGFHLKEWTYGELRALFRMIGFASWRGGLKRRGRYHELPAGLFAAYEKLIGRLPHRARRVAARAFLPRHIYARVVK